MKYIFLIFLWLVLVLIEIIWLCIFAITLGLFFIGLIAMVIDEDLSMVCWPLKIASDLTEKIALA